MQYISCNTNEVSYGGGVISRNGDTLLVKLHYNGAYGMGEKSDGLNKKGKKFLNRGEENSGFRGKRTTSTRPFFWPETGLGLYVKPGEERIFAFCETCLAVTVV